MMPRSTGARTIPYQDEHFGVLINSNGGEVTHPCAVTFEPSKQALPGWAVKITGMSVVILWQPENPEVEPKADFATLMNAYVFLPSSGKYPYVAGMTRDHPVPESAFHGDARYFTSNGARLWKTIEPGFSGGRIIFQKSYPLNTIATGIEGKTPVNLYTQTQDFIEFPGGILLPAGMSVAPWFLINCDYAGASFAMRMAWVGQQIKVD